MKTSILSPAHMTRFVKYMFNCVEIAMHMSATHKPLVDATYCDDVLNM